MLNPLRNLSGAFAGLALLLLLPLGAGATPLDSLVGTSLSIGGLTIEFTKVQQVGGIDLSQIELVGASDGLGAGFDLISDSGALSVANGAAADLKLEFTVASGIGIDGVGNHLTASVAGLFSSASVSELILEAPAIDVGVFATTFGSLLSNEQSFTEPLHQLTITKNLVVSADPQGTAAITLLQQRFSVVPEPTTAALLLLGITALAATGRSPREIGA